LDTSRDRSLFRRRGIRLARAAALAALLLSLLGCTASWQAPVESRVPRPAQPATPERSLKGVDVYRVVRGDTLYGIAWRSGIDYRNIARWNRLEPPYRIYVGQRLRLVAPATPARRQHAPPRRPRPVQESPAPQVATAKPVPASKPAPPAAPAPAKPSPPPARTTGLAWAWPAQGRIVAGFDADTPLRQGIRIGGRAGDSIRAAESGKVVYSGSGLIGYGRLIIVKHNDNYLSAYGHNRELLVREGDQVAKGQQIARMGTVGDGSPLLHFEIRRNGKPVNPTRYLPKRP
jgi:lipoprotein NlpD